MRNDIVAWVNANIEARYQQHLKGPDLVTG
jgi:hypothetical protein